MEIINSEFSPRGNEPSLGLTAIKKNLVLYSSDLTCLRLNNKNPSLTTLVSKITSGIRQNPQATKFAILDIGKS